MFEVLMRKYPDFRSEEVRQLLGRSFYYAYDDDRAARVLNGALVEYPELADDYDFMWIKFAAEGGRTSGLLDWRYGKRREWRAE